MTGNTTAGIKDMGHYPPKVSLSQQGLKGKGKLVSLEK